MNIVCTPGRQKHGSTIAAVMIAMLLGASAVPVEAIQADRRQVLQTPGLILETGAPLEQCNALEFSRTGRFLAAAGNDKTVRIWPLREGQLDRENPTVLRWATWREQRGSIYAMAFSPDEEERYVAIGGFGVRNESIAIIDHTTGEVVQGLTNPGHGSYIASLRFSADGQELAYGTLDGNVRLWRWDPDGPQDEVRTLGRHGDVSYNPVQWVRYLGPNSLVSVAQDGTVYQWNIAAGRAAARTALPRFQLQRLTQVVAGSQGDWLAASGFRADGRGAIELRSLDRRQHRALSFPEQHYPTAIAFDGRSRQLAIAVRRWEGEPFKPHRTSVYIYDVQGNRYVTDGLPGPSYEINRLAMSPSGGLLAMAGGDDHELVLWNADDRREADRVASPGNSRWGVGLSPDGRFLGLRDGRNPAPRGYNDWGAGPWKVYDLRNRGWATPQQAAGFQPLPPLESLEGWQVGFDRRNPGVWHVTSPADERFTLPLDREQYVRPLCYTFLRPARDGDAPRLAVGHRWGASVYDLHAEGPRLGRLLIGHAGDVHAIAPSEDHQLLVTASRDQTIAAWSLVHWEQQRELGASFRQRGNSVIVQEVADGSPGWEAGLTAGDEVVQLHYGGKRLTEGPAQWLETLDEPEPGRELLFTVRRENLDEPIQMLTTVRQRPLWRFFSTRDDEWVLWRWRDYFYDTSAQGDRYIGWQVNGDVDRTPDFFPAEQFRGRFHSPEKVEDILTSMRVSPERVALPDLVPPRVEIEVAEDASGDGYRVTLSALPREEAALTGEPHEISLWINDYKYRNWMHAPMPFRETVRVPKSGLRAGNNRIIAQAYSRQGVRGDSAERIVDGAATESKRRLFGMTVGIDEYSDAPPVPGRGSWQNLEWARADAEAIGRLLQQQGDSDLYGDAEIHLLADEQATREAILDRLERIAQAVQPDDLFVLFLAGHGWASTIPEHSYEPGTFTFAVPDFDAANPDDTGLRFAPRIGSRAAEDARTLYDALTAISCHKLILLDCCHAGSVIGSTNSHIIRELLPENIGPMIFLACAHDEMSFEIPFRFHGAFTWAVLEAIDLNFDQFDLNGDGRLDAAELKAAVQQRVPRLIDLTRDRIGIPPESTQRPQAYLPVGSEQRVLFAGPR